MKIATDFDLPLAIVDDVIGIVGRRGRGKTTTAVVIVEELHRAGLRFCVLDPIGVWWGLRSSRDGKGPGIPVVVMGGDHGDVPLEETAGKVVAQFLADHDASVVLDLSGFRKGQMARFAADFLEELYHKNRRPLHVVLDEADRFAPQRVMGETARLVGAAEDVCKMGRAHGLHPILITQRPASLNKNVLAQAGLLVAHGLTAPQDRKALDEWVRANAEEGERQVFLSALPGLARGVAWFWQPDERIFRQVAVRDRQTFDSSATPKAGERKGPRVLAEVDLDALKVRIADTIERAKAEDPKELRKTIAELRAQIKRIASPAPLPSFTDKLKAAVKAPAIKAPAIKAADLKRLESAITRMEKHAERLHAAQLHLDGNIEALRTERDRLAQAQQVVVGEAGQLRAAIVRANETPKREGVVAAPGRSTGAPAAAAPYVPPPARQAGPVAGLEGMTPARQRILDALAMLRSWGIGSAERTQLAFLADASPTSSAFANNLGGLRSAGLIDYQGGRVVLTTAGEGAAFVSAGPTTSLELQGMVRSKVTPAKWRILDVLIKAYPRAIERAALAEFAGASATSSAFANNLGSLRSLGLIDYQGGGVVALPLLFLERVA